MPEALQLQLGVVSHALWHSKSLGLPNYGAHDTEKARHFRRVLHAEQINDN